MKELLEESCFLSIMQIFISNPEPVLLRLLCIGDDKGLLIRVYLKVLFFLY